MRYSLTLVMNRATKNTLDCASEFMNGYVLICFIVARSGSAKDEK